MSHPDLLDPRQRLAACLLLSAVDLPAPLPDVAKLWTAAAKVCPGVKVDQALLGDRLAQLRRAHELVVELITEAIRG